MLFEAAEIAVERGPIDRELVLVEKRLLRRDGFFILRSDGPAFAGNFRGDSLGKFAQRTIVEEKRHFRLAEHINKARSDNAALRIDFALGMGFTQIADSRNAITADSNIRGEPGITRAVDDVAVANEEIVFAGIRGGIQIRVVSGSRNFSQCLTGHLLRALRIRSERNVIDVSGESQSLAVFGEDIAGKAFAVEHHLAAKFVFGAKRAGFCEDMACARRIGLNFREGTVFAENWKRLEKNLIVRTRRPIGEVVDHEVGAEKVGPIASGSIALRGTGQIELG